MSNNFERQLIEFHTALHADSILQFFPAVHSERYVVERFALITINRNILPVALAFINIPLDEISSVTFYLPNYLVIMPLFRNGAI